MPKRSSPRHIGRGTHVTPRFGDILRKRACLMYIAVNDGNAVFHEKSPTTDRFGFMDTVGPLGPDRARFRAYVSSQGRRSLDGAKCKAYRLSTELCADPLSVPSPPPT